MVDSKHGDIAVIETENHAMPRDAHIFKLLPLDAKTVEQLKGRPVYVLGFPYELVALYEYDLAKASMSP